MDNCPNCGALVDEGTVLCSYCGEDPFEGTKGTDFEEDIRKQLRKAAER